MEDNEMREACQAAYRKTYNELRKAGCSEAEIAHVQRVVRDADLGVDPETILRMYAQADSYSEFLGNLKSWVKNSNARFRQAEYLASFNRPEKM